MTDERRAAAPDERQPPSPEETMQLLGRVRQGDDDALNVLMCRLLPRLQRLAHGRLSRSARRTHDTGDVVQVVAARAFRRLAHIDVGVSMDLVWYLRTAIRNEIISLARQSRAPESETTAGESLPDGGVSQLEALIGAERMTRYETLLSRLEPADRELIVSRFELGYTYEEMARFLGRPTPEAARMALHRAVKRLTALARHA